ncbi:unnamed protein product [Psylliodes chrysocephalus]|uniref:Uncharacterized protein n=1 Tax=Psylliodes chrysocephalus TaxID=3402493 RepID=A0A9P0D1I4_9CUCU|nr:unnamed protein product [Psylliodes chrysocephala]
MSPPCYPSPAPPGLCCSPAYGPTCMAPNLPCVGPVPPPCLPLCGPSPGPCIPCNPKMIVGYRRPKVKIICGKRPRSREIKGGVMMFGCHCEKRNGLQDRCQRQGCLGAPECMTKPYASCGPSMYANGQHLPLRYKDVGIEECPAYPAFIRSNPAPGCAPKSTFGPYGPCSPVCSPPPPPCCPPMLPPLCPPCGPCAPPCGVPCGPIPCGPCPPVSAAPCGIFPPAMAQNMPCVAPCGPSPPGDCPLCAPCPARPCAPCGPCVGPCIPMQH